MSGSLNRGGQGPETLFIYGCPRSGTTWVQLLLNEHGGVATAPETQIFAFYLSGFRRQWGEEQEGRRRNAQGGGGLSQVLSQSGFEELCRLNASYVLERIRSRNPSAAVVVEKSPTHALHASFIRSLFPRAHFLHVIRDPRDTVASLLAAGRSWGAHWAPASPVEAARSWVRHVELGAAPRGCDRYHELRYEDLSADPVGRLLDVYRWLGLDVTEDAAKAHVEQCDVERLRKASGGPSGSSLPVPGRTIPAGFFRRGRVGGWREDLSKAEVRLVETVAGPLMDKLGYARSLKPGGRARLRLAAHDAVARIRESADWQLQRLLSRL